jgi:hypothetical protein
VEKEVAQAAERTVRLLEKRGVKIAHRKEPLPQAPFDVLVVIFRAVSLADAGIKDEADFKKKRDLLTETFAAFIEPGLKLTLGDYLTAQAKVSLSTPRWWLAPLCRCAATLAQRISLSTPRWWLAPLCRCAATRCCRGPATAPSRRGERLRNCARDHAFEPYAFVDP